MYIYLYIYILRYIYKYMYISIFIYIYIESPGEKNPNVLEKIMEIIYIHMFIYAEF